MTRYVVVFLLLAATATGASAQTATPLFTSEINPRNFAHAAFLGSGIYVVDGRQLYIIRTRMTFTMRPEEGNLFGVGLSATPTFGFYDLKFSDVGDFQLPGSLSTFSLLLGVEFRARILDNWRLDPFVRAGPAWEFAKDTTTWIFGTGVDSRVEFATGSSRILLWNSLLWAGNRESDLSPVDDFVRFDTQLDWLFPVGWRLHRTRTEIGPYARSEIYLDALLIEPPQGQPLTVNQRYEIGVIWGATERHTTFWKIPYPRVGLGWRFGDGTSGFRLVLTTNF